MTTRLLTRTTWIRSIAAATLATSVLASPVSAGVCDWLTGKPAQTPIPYGPPIYTPNPNPPVVGYGPVVPATGIAPATGVPAGTSVPAANIAPTLTTPPPSGYQRTAPPTGYGANYAPAVPAAVPGTAVPANTCPTCAPVAAPRMVTNYVPPDYRTTWVQVPVTTYRPVMATDPVTGLPVNAVLPCTTYQWQARRTPSGLFSGWFGNSAPPAPVGAPVAVPVGQPVVAGYAPPGLVGNVPQPVVTNYAFAPAPYAPAPMGCASGTCPNAPLATTVPAAAPYATFPANAAPLATPVVPSNTYPGAAPGSFPATPRPTTTITPSRPLIRGTEPADTRPQLNPSDLNRGGSFVPETRNYAPTEVESERMVPVPKVESQKIIDVPPPPVDDAQSQRTPIRQPGLLPLSRNTDQPASAAKPESKLRLVPDPDLQPLELRKHEIPQLISPEDRTTQRTSSPSSARGFSSVPIAWPAKTASTIVAKPVVESREMTLAPAQVKPVPTALTTEKLDDSGWKSIAK